LGEMVPLALESDMPSNEYEVSLMLSGFVQVRSNHGAFSIGGGGVVPKRLLYYCPIPRERKGQELPLGCAY
jgi:hypothetical protein